MGKNFSRLILLELLLLVLACLGLVAYLAPLASTALGFSYPQTWLILAQNHDELRATGGFISGIGTFTLNDARLGDLSLADSYAVDDLDKPYPSPPDALSRYMLAGIWLPRDANWSPDFPTTANQAAELYAISTGNSVQGVLAFDQTAVQGVLQVLGPVSVPGTPEPVTAESVEGYMQAAWAPESADANLGEWYAHRKDFMGSLGKAILGRALSLRDPGKLLQLAQQVLALGRQGHLMVYSTDAALQSWVARFHLAGSLANGNGDTLALVDSNIGFNKMDGVVQRALSYQVDLRDPSHPTGKVTLAYANPAPADIACLHQADYGESSGQITYQNMQQRCYWDYWRVYTNEGSVLTQTKAEPVPAEQLLSKEAWTGQVESLTELPGLQTFAGLVVVPGSQQRQAVLDLQLPAGVVEHKVKQNTYRLHLQKQAGLDKLLVSLQVQLPAGSQILSGTTQASSSTPTSWSWQGYLTESTDFTLNFSPGQGS